MVRCRYLAIDYESDFAQKRRSLRNRLTITNISSPTEDIRRRKDIFSYRMPWIGVSKETESSSSRNELKLLLSRCESLNATDIEFEPLMQGKTSYDVSELKAFTESDKDANATDSKLFEEVEGLESIKVSQPSILRLLRKHSNLVLSDPYAEIANVYKKYEKLDISKIHKFNLDDDSSFEIMEATNSKCSLDIDEKLNYEVDNDFLDEIKETLEGQKPDIDNTDLEKIKVVESSSVKGDFGSYVSMTTKHFKNDEVLSTFPKSINSHEIKILQVDQVLERSFFELEVPSNSNPVYKIDLIREALENFDMKKINLIKISHEDFHKITKCADIENIFVNGMEREDWNTARVSHLLLSETVLKEANLPEIDATESTKCSDLCRPQSRLSTSDIELALHWSFTTHVKSLITKLQRLEKLDVEILQQKPTEFNNRNSYCTDAEVFEELVPVIEENTEDRHETENMRNVLNLAQTPVVCDLDSTEDYQDRAVEQKISEMKKTEKISSFVSPEIRNVESENLKKQDQVKKQPSKRKICEIQESASYETDEFSLDSFLQMRGKMMKPKIQKFIRAVGSKKGMQVAVETIHDSKDFSSLNSVSSTSIPTIPSFPPVEDSNYRLVKVNITGGILRIILDIESYIEPIFNQLKTFRVIPEQCDIRNINEDMSKYLLKQSKRFVQDSSGMVQHPQYVLLVMLHCFIVCKSRLVNLSPASGLGFLIDFYQNNKEMLESLIHLNEFNDFKSMLSLIPLAIHTLQQSIMESHLIHPKIAELEKIVYERLYKDSRRDGSITKILILCDTKCQHLFDEIIHILIKNCSSEIGVNPIALPFGHQSYTVDDFVKNAIARF
ncbi:uncharacterized protein LOC144411675 [Styela clava]